MKLFLSLLVLLVCGLRVQAEEGALFERARAVLALGGHDLARGYDCGCEGQGGCVCDPGCTCVAHLRTAQARPATQAPAVQPLTLHPGTWRQDPRTGELYQQLHFPPPPPMYFAPPPMFLGGGGFGGGSCRS